MAVRGIRFYPVSSIKQRSIKFRSFSAHCSRLSRWPATSRSTEPSFGWRRDADADEDDGRRQKIDAMIGFPVFVFYLSLSLSFFLFLFFLLRSFSASGVATPTQKRVASGS